jgi:hypothetical protein
MRKNNLVIKTDEPMEKLAFTFYSDLCEIDLKAANLFSEGYGDKNYKQETYIACQTIKAYPKPYEERIRADAVKQALGLLEEWDYHNNRDFLKPHPVFHDMIRMVREKPEEVLEHVKSLRHHKGGKE